ncbi:MAG TPA: CHAT domain-containing tetratricopeptide repeat protein [Pyrinomonadaceae bacterium]|jgi:CHAT domain-containing protein/predicted negative regulator of RcsB-dependent stress response|nr:CHAT domain-containing tetratricopeptide repeat protein [Pyrinomonadaceae bacterium]
MKNRNTAVSPGRRRIRPCASPRRFRPFILTLLLVVVACLFDLKPEAITRVSPMPQARAKAEPERPQVEAQETLVPARRDAVEKEISAGRAHSYRITLNAGQYLRLNVECWGVNVRAAIYDPGGHAVADIPCYRRGLAPASVIADASGVYRLEVGAAQDENVSVSGLYRIQVGEFRRATLRDLSHILAETAFAEAERLRAARLIGSGDEAIKKYEEARDHWLAAGDRRATVYALRNIGQVYQSLSLFQKALDIYAQALALSRNLRDRRAESDVLNNIAYLQSGIGNNVEASANATRALKLSQATGNGSGQAQALHTFGDIYYNFGELKKALGYHGQAMQLWERLHDYQGQAEVLVSFGYAYVEVSNIQAALDAYNRALSISRAAGDAHSEAVALRALGNLQTKLGEHQQAFGLFFQALEILKTLDDPHLKAIILGGLAYTYECVNEWRSSLEYYERALSVFKEIGHQWGEAEAEMPIGEIYFSQGQYQNALRHYEQALRLFRSLKMPRWEAMTIRNIGMVYASLGDKVKALEHYKHALALTRAGQDQRHEAYTLNHIGQLHEDSGERQNALVYYRRALQLNRVALDRSGESLTLYNIAHAERDENRLDEARTCIESALEIAESLRANVASQNLRASYFASTRQYYDLYIDTLMRLHKERPDEGFAAAAFNVSEKARARSLLESLKEARVDIRQGVPAALLDKDRSLQQLLAAKAERHIQLLTSRQRAEAEIVAKELDQITAQYDEVKAQIKAASPHYAALTQPQPLSLREIQQQVLDDDSLLLEYALGDDRSYVWLVTRTDISSFELPNRDRIESEARHLYELLTADQPLPGETFEQHRARAAQAAAQLTTGIARLSETVLAPLGGQLSRKRVLIVTDGALQYIPFQVLTLPETARRGGDLAGGKPPAQTIDAVPLISTHEIINEPSASTLALQISETANRNPAPKSVAVLADPVFEVDDPRLAASASGRQSISDEVRQAFRDVAPNDTGVQIPRLLASRKEAEAIMAVSPPGARLKALGFEANRATAMSDELKQYRIVHFATHGILNSTHPELSGIVLSLFDQQRQPQNGFLKLDDIYNLDLAADLVVLSACNTGLGKDIKGEGLVGLTRGFMHAGASTVVASLWKVDDDATAELMKHFYSFMLNDGLSPSAALRQSQLAMQKQKQWRDPFYWAAFVIQGQYREGTNLGYHKNDMTGSLTALAAFALSLSLGAVHLKRRRKKLPERERATATANDTGAI